MYGAAPDAPLNLYLAFDKVIRVESNINSGFKTRNGGGRVALYIRWAPTRGASREDFFRMAGTVVSIQQSFDKVALGSCSSLIILDKVTPHVGGIGHASAHEGILHPELERARLVPRIRGE